MGDGRFAVIGWFTLALGCAKPAAAPAPLHQPAKPLAGAEQFMPLKDGIVFAYDTLAEISGEKGLLVLEVRRRQTEMADLMVAGHVQRVEIDATGIRHVTGGWLLKEPLVLGARWQGDFGQVEVTAIDRKPSVGAGTFTGCLETVEATANAEFSKRTTTVFCPGVGIVTRRTEAESEQGAGIESMALRSFGPRFQAPE